MDSLTLKQRHSQIYLSKYTPDSPHVHPFRIVPAAEEQLRGPIPAGHDLAGHFHGRPVRPSQAEISQLCCKIKKD